MKQRRIDKPWGYEEIVEENDRYVVKKLFMKKGHRCSLQYHEYKKETIIVLDGTLEIPIGHNGDYEALHTLGPFDTITIEPLKVHRMYGVTDCLYLECSTTELNDVIRLDDDYNRK